MTGVRCARSVGKERFNARTVITGLAGQATRTRGLGIREHHIHARDPGWHHWRQRCGPPAERAADFTRGDGPYAVLAIGGLLGLPPVSPIWAIARVPLSNSLRLRAFGLIAVPRSLRFSRQPTGVGAGAAGALAGAKASAPWRRRMCPQCAPAVPHASLHRRSAGQMGGEPACRPGSVRPLARGDGHPSGTAVAGSLVRSTREHRAGRPRTLAQGTAGSPS
jgi:hypothetical protein